MGTLHEGITDLRNRLEVLSDITPTYPPTTTYHPTTATTATTSPAIQTSFAYHCSYQEEWGTHHGTEATDIITFHREYFGTTSQDIIAGLDVETGLYTAGHAGVYQVTWSLDAWDSLSYIYLYKNDHQMPESLLYGGTAGSGNDFSSRTMYMRLDLLDQIYLYCEHCYDVRRINFCVALVQPDP